MIEEGHERKAYLLYCLVIDCEAPILDWRGHQRPLPFPWIDREGGQNFRFFHVVKELNNVFFVLSKS
jgi:hypothetical protein